MQKLSNHLNSLNFSNQLPYIRGVIDKAEVKITFWGGRRITVKGYSGSFSLDELSTKIYRNSYERMKAHNFSDKERLHGISISKKLTSMHNYVDSLVKGANFFTRLLFKIRTYRIINPYTSFNKEGNLIDSPHACKSNYSGYPTQTYVKKFGSKKGSLGEEIGKGSYMSNGRYIYAREETIRSQFKTA